jgi:HptB-dependent secretion and biofilm anti anti-sigma factor
MDIRITTNESTATLILDGRFDFNAHRTFKEAYDSLLKRKGIANLEINLTGVSYLDSSALGMLLLLRERADSEGISVALTRPSGTVAQILDIANFGKVFTIR